MMFRQLQQVRDKMDLVHQPLRNAILADSTRDMSLYLGQAQAAADETLNRLQGTVNAGVAGLSDEDGALLRAAERALDLALDAAGKVALGNNVREMRDRLLEFKTQVDFAEAYVCAALGVVDTA
jgi:hypothetical protein